jgi:serine/threonine protein kinase
LHSIGYVHNDIKLANILIKEGETPQVILIDFGISSPIYLINEFGEKVHIKKECT